MSSSLNVPAFSKIPAPDSSRQSGKPAVSASALLVSTIQDDRRSLEEIFFQRQWTLFRAGTVRAAISLLRENEIPVVISERDAAGGGWKKVLSSLQRFPRPPLLVVTSRLADECLWAEALNLGAYDVLATPFRSKELVWVLENAWRRCGFALGAQAMAASVAGF